MATSPHAGRVRFPSAFLYDAGQQTPVSSLAARDYYLNNLCHYADEGGAQARVAFSGLAPGLGSGQGYLDTDALSSTDRWYHIASWGPWPLPIREAGHSYRLRVFVGGASSSGGTAVKFRLVLGPPDVTIARSMVSDVADYCYETATTSTSTAAWLAGASQGELASTYAMRLAQRDVERMRTRQYCKATIGGAPTGVDQCLVALHVFGSVANVAARPRLHGLYACDFVGE